MTAPLWFLTRDGDPVAYALARRHYSAWKNRRPKIRQFVGPGDKVVLITECGRAVWAWRKYIDDNDAPFERDADGRIVACTIFRNEESGIESSQLVRQAGRIADAIWPGERRYTFIDPQRIASANPGYCFKRAGWRLVRDDRGEPVRTKKGQLILEDGT